VSVLDWPRLPRTHADRGRAEVMLRAGCVPTDAGHGWEGGRCEGCGRSGQRLDFSHRVAEGQGGPVTAANGAALCGPGGAGGCHGWAGNHRVAAQVLGWILGSWQDPSRTPLWLVGAHSPDGGWFLPGWFGGDPDGAGHVLIRVEPGDYQLPEVPSGPSWAVWVWRGVA
jgi:hypothetical protein